MRLRRRGSGVSPEETTGTRRRSEALVVVAVAALMVSGCAPRAYVLGADRPRSCVPRIGTNQVIVPLPGLLLPLPSIKGLSEFDDLEPASDRLGLPSRVDLRDNTQGFDGYAEFVIRDGLLYTRPRNPGGDSGSQWRKVRAPRCLDGHIVAVSVDSNMAVVLDSDGWIYSLDNLLSGPMLWNWTRSFGAPLWLWPAMKVPNEALAPGRWAIGRFGDMYTRKYDLDLAGANHIPCRYSWQEQGDKSPAPNQWEERTGVTHAAISLPAEDWQHQPKIPGEVSARISISQTGPAMEDREFVGTRLAGKPISEIWVHATLDELVVRPARLLAAPLGTLPRG